MKRFIPVLAIFLAFTCTLAPVDAYAKKFGGSKSFGKSFKTAPTQKSLFKSPSNSQKPAGQSGQKSSTQQNQTANSQGQPQNKRGMFGGIAGGLLGGMLAGSLLGSLFGGGMGGAASGLGMILNLLMLAGIVFLGLKLFRSWKSKQQGQYQTSPNSNWSSQSNSHNTSQNSNNFNNSFRNNGADSSQQDADFSSPSSAYSSSSDTGSDWGDTAFRKDGAHQTQKQTLEQSQASDSGFGGTSDVPFELPPEFDINGFLSRARDHYRKIQESWNSGDMSTIEEYVSPDLFAHLNKERQTLTGDQHTEVMYVDAEIVRAQYMYGKAELSLQFTGRYRDNVERVEEKITDIWHLEQIKPNAPWLIVGIEYAE